MKKNNVTFRLYPRAIEDLEAIYTFSYKNFGQKQARKYIDVLESTFEKMASYSDLARNCDYIKKNLKAYVVESHVIFFKIKDEEVVIIRVLHKSMDFLRHF